MRSLLSVLVLVLVAAALPAWAACEEDEAAAAEVDRTGWALDDWLAAGEAGDREAQSHLGTIYARGWLGVDRDLAVALDWHRRAAEQGNSMSQYVVGSFYAKCSGTKQDAAEAARWFAMGAENCNPAAQIELAQMYEEGIGVKRDPVAAYMWFEIALALGRGDERFRSRMAGGMSDKEIAEAQARAQAWLAEH
jgi:hypothetical protein